jgi:transcriptional regulator with XRE-family HTH domain
MTGALFDAAAFGARVLARRTALGLTTRAAGEAAGVSAASVCRAERGEPTLAHETVLRLEAWLSQELIGQAEQ